MAYPPLELIEVAPEPIFQVGVALHVAERSITFRLRDACHGAPNKFKTGFDETTRRTYRLQKRLTKNT